MSSRSCPKNLTSQKGIFDLYKTKIPKNSLTEKVYPQREDGSRLCLLVALGEVLGITTDTTALSCNNG
jgi:hypothetical protein